MSMPAQAVRRAAACRFYVVTPTKSDGSEAGRVAYGLHSHHPQHLLSRPVRHAGLRGRSHGSGVGYHFVSRAPFGLQYGCSKRARIHFLALTFVRCYTCKLPLFLSGRCWVRTSDPLLVREVLYP